MRKVLLLILFFSVSCLKAQDDFRISSYIVQLHLKSSGILEVEERIQLEFLKSRRGIIREIPLKAKLKDHVQKMSISNVEVFGHEFKTYKEGGDYKIRIGKSDVYLKGTQQYIIKYQAENAILNFLDHEELYWTLIGTKWDADILDAQFIISFEKDLELEAEDVRLFSGDEGATTNYGSYEILNNEIRGKNLSILGKGKGMTIGVKFPKGYIFSPESPLSKEIPPPKSYPKDYSWPFTLLMMIGAFAGFLKWGRSPKLSEDELMLGDNYYPPENMSPAEVGTFYDFTPNKRDVVSLIPYWGHLGMLRIDRVAFGRDDELYLEKLAELDDDAPEYEQIFFACLFETGDRVELNSLNKKFYSTYQEVAQKLKRDLDPGNYDSEAKSLFHSNWSILAAVICWLLGVLAIVFFKWLFTAISLFALGLVVFVIRFLEPKKSLKGLKLHARLEQFKKNISDPEDKKLHELIQSDPNYLEKIFPYVVAFGIDQDWLKDFKGLFEKGPSWYYDDMVPHVLFHDFARDFKIRQVESVISAPPVASSGSSSFGGGGGTGGGFGGGGGSSW